MRDGGDHAADREHASAPMPPGWRRAILFLLLGAGALYLAVWLVVRVRSLLLMLLVSLFPAFAMEPAS